MKLYEFHLREPEPGSPKVFSAHVSLVDYEDECVYILKQGQIGRIGTKDGTSLPFSALDHAYAEGERKGTYTEDQLPAWKKFARGRR